MTHKDVESCSVFGHLHKLKLHGHLLNGKYVNQVLKIQTLQPKTFLPSLPNCSWLSTLQKATLYANCALAFHKISLDSLKIFKSMGWLMFKGCRSPYLTLISLAMDARAMMEKWGSLSICLVFPPLQLSLGHTRLLDYWWVRAWPARPLHWKRGGTKPPLSKSEGKGCEDVLSMGWGWPRHIYWRL